MSKEYRVVVKGGGHNLFYIKEEYDSYSVYQHIVNLIWDDQNYIGETDSLDDAVDLIREHSGEEIDEID